MVHHSWECLKEILVGDWTDGILCSIGMPVINGSEYVHFGYGYMKFNDNVRVAAEVCEELFVPVPPHTELSLNCVQVFMNASKSHHQLRKLDIRLSAFRTICHRLILVDECCCVVINEDVVAKGSQFFVKDVEVVVAQVDLDTVDSLRGSISSFQEQASAAAVVPLVRVQYNLCRSFKHQMPLSSPLKITYHSPEQEITYGPG
ncbi:hypothetical protein IFM89_036480 [Coptis chinensis]|uniref:Uncharacterized protein n=1 Tax=Coptis chinensis TaxID=261450 RepID=A0A835IWZ6_9MAGN|nr:hypothetical protein IFM89_036480 [Coptis chinensis]